MKGGIIQEVFSKPITFYRCLEENEFKVMINADEVHQILEEIQQEIIEKIKQKSIISRVGGFYYISSIDLITLIGDNND